VAWAHAHRAHALVLESDVQHLAAHDLHDPAAAEPYRRLAERCGRRATQHAAVAQALLACLDPARPRHEAGA
jgi:hypothetical protein